MIIQKVNTCDKINSVVTQMRFLRQFSIFYFFIDKFHTHQKAPKSTKKHQKHKKHQKAQKRNQAKAQNTNKRRKIKNARKKHLSGKKMTYSLICIFALAKKKK